MRKPLTVLMWTAGTAVFIPWAVLCVVVSPVYVLSLYVLSNACYGWRRARHGIQRVRAVQAIGPGPSYREAQAGSNSYQLQG